MSQPNAELFVDYNNVTGQPYVGIEYSGGGVAVRMFVADPATADTVLAAFTDCVKHLKTLKPKIIGANSASLR